VLFLDGDVVPIPGSIDEMLDILVSNDQWPGVYYDVHGDIYDEAGATPVELPLTMADMSTCPGSEWFAEPRIAVSGVSGITS
jgi:hypothetical protein